MSNLTIAHQIMGVAAVTAGTMVLSDALHAVWCAMTGLPWNRKNRVWFFLPGGALVVWFFYLHA